MNPALLSKYHNELILQASCQVISKSASSVELELTSNRIDWREIISKSMKHKIEFVRESAATAMAAASKLTNCSGDVKR